MSCGRMRASTTSFSCVGTMSRIGSRGPIDFADRRDAQRHHSAVDRRAHELALGLVAATAARALRARESAPRIPSPRRSPAADTGCAPARCAPAARRARCRASARSLCALGEPAAIVGLVALQLQQPRALHEALAHELLVDLQLLAASFADAAVASICFVSAAACARASRVCASSDAICSSSVRRRASNSAVSRARCSRAPGASAELGRRLERRRERGFRRRARIANALRVAAGRAAGSARHRCARRRRRPAAGPRARSSPSRTRICARCRLPGAARSCD